MTGRQDLEPAIQADPEIVKKASEVLDKAAGLALPPSGVMARRAFKRSQAMLFHGDPVPITEQDRIATDAAAAKRQRRAARNLKTR